MVLTCKGLDISVSFLALSTELLGADLQLDSPNKQIRIKIKLTDRIYYGVEMNGALVMWYAPVSMSLAGGIVLGSNPVLESSRENSKNKEINTVWGIRSVVPDHYNELVLRFKSNYSLIFRAYDDGVAYRFETHFPGSIIVQDEQVEYRFLEDHPLVAHVVGDFQTSYEKLYTRYRISEVVEKDFISLPLIVAGSCAKLAISESDVFDYPGMYIMRQGNNNRHFLKGLFPRYPLAWKPGGLCQFNLRVTERADYIAATNGSRLFPWRLMILAKEDEELADSDMVYRLARPAKVKSDWVQPGKVAWDWWNDWNLEGVDFETGVNNKTYEYYIDFASKNGLEYIIMDEGWSDQFDLLLQKPGIDVPYLVNYAEQRNVKVILWCVWHTLDRQMKPALDQFEKWRVAGVKVDFIDRDDQIAINFYETLAREAAKRRLLVNIHGCSKPTGLHRTYPNVINYEGVPAKTHYYQG